MWRMNFMKFRGPRCKQKIIRTYTDTIRGIETVVTVYAPASSFKDEEDLDIEYEFDYSGEDKEDYSDLVKDFNEEDYVD